MPMGRKQKKWMSLYMALVLTVTVGATKMCIRDSWNSVSMADGRKYHSNAKSYYTEIRKISDELCRNCLLYTSCTKNRG